jgi:curli biogenesis system outer membrane secretion channel CsgG
MMKENLFFAFLFFLIALIAGCVLMRPSVHPDKSGLVASLPVYAGPQVKVAVADFELKAAKASGEIAAGLREMLLVALSKSNRFKVQVAGQADLIIQLAVAEFEPQTSGGSAGTGGGGGVNRGAIGGLLGGISHKAHIAMEVRIIDAVTSGLIASGQAQGQAADISGAMMAGSSTSWALGSKLFAYANTPMEKAIRICIIEAARYISASIPESYYKY